MLPEVGRIGFSLSELEDVRKIRNYDERNIVLPAYQKLKHFNAKYEPKAKHFQIYKLIANPSLHLQ